MRGSFEKIWAIFVTHREDSWTGRHGLFGVLFYAGWLHGFGAKGKWSGAFNFRLTLAFSYTRGEASEEMYNFRIVKMLELGNVFR